MIDLDSVLANYKLARDEGDELDVAGCADDIPALVAELRAARKVVEAAADYRERLSGGGAVDKWARLAAALAAYDQEVTA